MSVRAKACTTNHRIEEDLHMNAISPPEASSHQQPHLQIWPVGVPIVMDVPDESLWTAFAWRAQKAPEEQALHFMGRTYSWAELVHEAEHLAGGLQSLGVAKGDRVLLFMQNCPQYVIGFHAVLRLGAVVVPLNPMNKADELGHYILDAGAHIAIAASDVAGELAAASSKLDNGLRHLVLFDLAEAMPERVEEQAKDWPKLWQSWLLAQPPSPELTAGQVHRWRDLVAAGLQPADVSVAGHDLALLPYTSGTTGLAKGCMHTHASLMHNALAGGPWLDLRTGDRQLIVVPMFHITGLVMGMLASIRHGCAMVLLPRWDRRSAARTIERLRITHWPNIPTMVVDLLSGEDLGEYDLSSLRYIGGGGAPMPDAVSERLKQVFGLDYVEGYGLTETAAPTHLNPRHAARRHCLGIPFVSTKALVVNPDTLQPLAPGEVGEILVQGPQLFKGYWYQPEATREAFVEIDGQSWFRTGDLGRMDEDGYFYMADRLKRMINASGFKVWPAEVEALLQHHPAIKEACVIAKRDSYRGETVKALVVLHESQRGQVSSDDIVAWSREHMAAYKYPREVELVNDLPRTASGKVLWRAAQAEQDDRDKRLHLNQTYRS